MTISRLRHPVAGGPSGRSPTACAAVADEGSLIAVAGQLGTNEYGELEPGSSAADQVRQAFDNVARILSGLELGLVDVLRFTTYIVGRENLATFHAVRDSLLADVYDDGVYPPNTLVLVAGLYDERFVVEIEAWAIAPAQARGDG